MDALVRIKRAVLAGRYAFSEKARREMEAGGLTELDVAESIVNAQWRSTKGFAPGAASEPPGGSISTTLS